MTKPLSMASHNNLNLGAWGFCMFLTSKLITCFIDGFTSKREFQSIVHLLTMNWNIYIGFWTLKMKCTQYGLYEQAAFNPSEGQHAWRTNRVLEDIHSEWQHHGKRQLLLCWSGGHREREVFGKRCPNRVGREVKSFRGQWRWWAPPVSITPDRARWGSYSVCRPQLHIIIRS